MYRRDECANVRNTMINSPECPPSTGRQNDTVEDDDALVLQLVQQVCCVNVVHIFSLNSRC